MLLFRVNRRVLLIGTALTSSGGIALSDENVAPSFSVNPALSGDKKVGATLTSTNGSFWGDPTPTITSRTWQYSTDGSDAAHGTIRGASSTTYTVHEDYENMWIRSGVTITNSEGSTTAYSDWYGLIEEASGYPNETNTGYTGSLTNYTGSNQINTDGEVIENKRVTFRLYINANNVIIRNCHFEVTDWYAILATVDGNFLTVEDCRIQGNGGGNSGISASGLFQRNHITGYGNGIVLHGGSSTVRDNYIHGLGIGPGADPEEHVDGVSVQGGQSNVLIEHNTIMSWNTSCVIIKTDFNPISNVRVNDNLLLNEALDKKNAYPLYSVDGNYGGDPTGTQFTNNKIQKGNWGGYWSITGSVTTSGNTNYDTDQPI